MNRSRTALTALALLSVLALGACSGSDPQPKFADPTPTEPTAPSTTAVSGPVEPTMPAAARGTDAASAEAFVKFYWEMVNYAQATGDVEGMRAIGTQCMNCDNGVDFIQRAYQAGGEIRGGDGRASRLKTRFVKRAGQWWAVVECRVKLTKQTVDLPGRSHDERYPGGPANVRFYLQPMSGGWTVRSVATQ